MNKKKEVIHAIKQFKRILKSGDIKTVLEVSDWDIHAKIYTTSEIAARFLRMKGYNIQITISDNTERPAYLFGYIRFYRYVTIKFNFNQKKTKKSKLKWRIIWITYCIPVVLLAVPVLLFSYALKPFFWLGDRMNDFKWYLVRKYKP